MRFDPLCVTEGRVRMGSAQRVMVELKSKGSEKTRKTYARHGMPMERTLGVSVADLKVIAKTIRNEQEVALELYATGVMEAMYLAGLVAKGAPMTKAELQQWADGAVGLPMIAEYTVPWVTVENGAGREMALKWMSSKKEQVASSGWCAYAGLVATKADAELDLGEIAGLLKTVAAGVSGAQNRERYTMNAFVIAVGAYVRPLLKQAVAAAEQMGNVSVDVGETACSVPVARDAIAKIEAMGRAGKKRKTIRC